MRIVHFFNSYHGLGGVEAILKHHHQLDARFDIDSQFIIYYEDGSIPVERVHFLGITGRSTIRDARVAVAAALAKFTPDVAVYHAMWGSRHFGDLDKSSRRVAGLHGDTPEGKRLLRSAGKWFDGFFCDDDPVRRIAQECLPELADERFAVLPVPISPIGAPGDRSPLDRRPITIGVSARLCVPQKRVDRIPALARQLDNEGVDFRFEFLGDGTEKRWLESQLPDRQKYIFHGRKNGEEYWEILKKWDVILFVSDYEGMPLSLVEALSMGIIPIYPRINSGADAPIQRLQPALLYEPEAYASIAGALRWIKSLDGTALADLRARCRQAVSEHLADNYLLRFSGFMQRILALPRAGTARFPKYPWPLNDLSFAWLQRLSAARRKVWFAPRANLLL
jgi:glycosyltransferase involved in cell wall biosynthesis